MHNCLLTNETHADWLFLCEKGRRISAPTKKASDDDIVPMHTQLAAQPSFQKYRDARRSVKMLDNAFA